MQIYVNGERFFVGTSEIFYEEIACFALPTVLPPRPPLTVTYSGLNISGSLVDGGPGVVPVEGMTFTAVPTNSA
jgi:hypothetical protein